MFTITPDLKTKMEQRLVTLPVDARLLLLAGNVFYDETLLGDGVISTLRQTEDGFIFSVNSTLTRMEQNQACAHGLAHLMLHSAKLAVGDIHVDTIGQAPNPFEENDPLDNADCAAANRLALEILIPTIPLREAFLYFEGNTNGIANRFGVPAALAHAALIQRNMMDARSCA